MKKSIALSDLFLVLLICIAVTLIILFVDFSDNELKNRDVDVYKAYYLYDEKSEPISLSYEMVELPKDSSIESAIEEVFEVIKENYSKTVRLNDVILENNKAIIVLNEDIIVNESKNKIDALVNSILDIKDLDELVIKIEESEVNYTYQSNISDYYVNSPIQNKLTTFLYKDENYVLTYKNNLDETINFKIIDSGKDYTNYLITIKNEELKEKEIKWHVKSNGLYRDNDKILNDSFKVGDTYEVNSSNKATINYVRLQDDGTLLIEILITNENMKEIITLKQGLGIYKYSKYENDMLIEEYSYIEKIFNEG